jgi:2-keto-4-pentenoate hydratase
VLPDRERYAPGVRRQLQRLAGERARGMPRRGWKIGINVPEILAGAGLTHAGIGWLSGWNALKSGDSFEPPAGARVEAELALHVASPVPPSASAEEALAALSGVAPALEVVDYGLQGGSLDDIVAHSMFHAAWVIGSEQPAERAEALGTRWPILQLPGVPPPEIRADLVPEHLGDAAVFAARFLADFGEALEAGDWLLSGSYCARAQAIDGVSEVRADFGRLGDVRLRIGRAG